MSYKYSLCDATIANASQCVHQKIGDKYASIGASSMYKLIFAFPIP